MRRGPTVVIGFAVITLLAGMWTGLLKPIEAEGVSCGTAWIPRLPEAAPFVTGPTAEQCAYLATGPAISAAAACLGGLLLITLGIILDSLLIRTPRPGR